MPQAKQGKQEETQAEKRARERREQAEAQVKKDGYKPREGGAFDAARGYASAQFDIAVEVAERYEALLKDRAEVRTMLRSLYHQKLLTVDEATLMFEMFPEREAPGQRSSANGQQAPAPAAA
jgi:hypothetical protein